MATEAPSGRVETPRHDYYQPQPMAEWYHPYQLLTTALQVLVWEYVGQGRAMEERARSSDVLKFDDRADLWFDYVADTGDGWNPTFAIASLLAEPKLWVTDVSRHRKTWELDRGRFLLIGGDEVYPVPTQRNYLDRFVGPYQAALPGPTRPPRPPSPPGPEDAERPRMLAIPGNHDWYDGLVSFTRQFTQFRSVGDWITAQEQSYFALALPQRWWLWAMDVLPQSHMDFGQRRYFVGAAEKLQKGDRVILVAAEPDWASRRRLRAEESLFWTIERDLIVPREARVHLWLAGDLHHYRRHELRDANGSPDANFQRITSGGGGAYTSPTHRPARRSVVVDAPTPTDAAGNPTEEKEYVRRMTFPSPASSWRLSFLNLMFAARNWKMGVFPMGVLYWLLTWVRLPEAWPAPEAWLETFRSPGMLLWLFVILGGFVVYADKTSKWFRWIGGLAHGLTHVLVAGAVTGFINGRFLEGGVAVTDVVAANVLNFVAGMVFGPTIFGVYLLLALSVFGYHWNQAFSSLRIQDYKHFLRLHVTAEGLIRIFPIAVRKVPRAGRGRARYMLIEDPIEIDPRTKAGAKPAS